MSLINKEITDFSTDAFHNGQFIKVTKEDILKNEWSIFFFYPADFTFVCPTELEDLADNYAKFKAEEEGKGNIEIYAVSCDTHFVHKAWHDTSASIKKIQFPMLADPCGHLAKAFDVFIQEVGLADRGTFLINNKGEIVLYEVSAGGIGRSSEELLRKLQAAKFVKENGGEVCPAKWKKGKKGLSTGIDQVGKI